MNKRFSLLICVTFVAITLCAQSFNFKVYDTSEGLADNDVIALVQDKDDYVWMATDEGLIRFDGIDYDVFTIKDSLSHNYISCLHIDQIGRLWIGHKNGLLTYRENDQFYKVRIEGTSQLISDISEDDKGNIWLIDQKKGLIRIDGQNGTIKTFFDRKKYGRKNYTAVEVINENELLVGTARQGLFSFNFSDTASIQINKIDGIPNVWINRIKKSNTEGKFWIGTRSDGFYSYHTDYSSEGVAHVTDNSLCRKFNINKENVTDIHEEAESHLLISTVGSGVIRLIYDPLKGDFADSFMYSNNNGLSNNDVQDILCDREGNYWFGTKGGGVSLLVNQYFVFYNLDEIGFPYKARSVFKDGDDLWIGLDKGLLLTDPTCYDPKYYDAEYGGIADDAVIGFYKTDDETIWIATATQGLFYKKKGANSFKQKVYLTNKLALHINDITSIDNQLLLATQDGLIIIDLSTNKITNYQIEDGLSHNNINFVHVDQSNNIWVGPKDGGLCKIDPSGNRIERHPVIDGMAIDVTGMTEDLNGQIWISTKGDGVINYTNDSTRFIINQQEGLRKDFCYDIQCDIKNRLWVCHDGGLSRIDVASGTARVYGHNEDLGSVFNQAVLDKEGNIWFASNAGAINYLPVNDRPNNVAPKLNITRLMLDDVEVPVTNKLHLKYPYGVGYYKLHIDFRAISFKNPEGVVYEFKIEDAESDEEEKGWTKLGQVDFKEIDYLRNGHYKIKIRAFNSDGKVTSLYSTINVTVNNPFWYKAWFIVLMVLALGFVVYLIGKFRERSLIKRNQRLQSEVDSQTLEIREKTEELERKNQDITDSINYAKKIQSSILPSMNDLITVLPESFVYFAPRDIVSGDFYWFNRTKDYFIACCADCTGHGVPGAFMSMIGTTILNDIFRIPSIDSPAAMLERLDEEVKKLLQKNEGNESMDGMDISIVEMHIPTRRIRLASAKRPIYLVIGDEMTVYKGSRRSIGDSYEERLSPFVNVEYNCKPGDTIYMFSDGYSDQFGGPLGRKFMKVGVQNLIEQIRDKSGKEQHRIVKKNFEDWRGDLEQIDDVLFMGLRL